MLGALGDVEPTFLGYEPFPRALLGMAVGYWEPGSVRGVTGPASNASMDRRTILTPPGAPVRMPGMVSGVRAGGFLLFSALRGRPPGRDDMSDDPKEQARSAFDNLELLLDARASRSGTSSR